MNCMRLPWTVEQAKEQKYMCEECAPKQHEELLKMLKDRTWQPLPIASIEADMGECEVEAGLKNEDDML